MSRKEWILKKETELRCEVHDSEILTIRLLDGTAETFGIELPIGKELVVSDDNIAIFSWYGCTVETICSGPQSVMDVYDNTPMINYANVHVQLEAMRDVAAHNNDIGPNVLIIGPNNFGKTSVAKILSAYAVRLDRCPVYVDLDVSQGLVTIPGCLSAVVLEKGFVNAEDGFSMGSPLVHYYGHLDPKQNVDLYKHLISQMSYRIRQRQAADPNCRSSGMIINTTGWVEAAGIEVIHYLITELQVSIVLVLSPNDRLYSSLTKASNADQFTAVKLPHSGGIVNRDSAVRKRNNKTKIREYFYGRRPLIMSKMMSAAVAAASSASSSSSSSLLVSNSSSSSSSVSSSVLSTSTALSSIQFSPSRMTLRISDIRLLRAGMQVSEGMRLIGDSIGSNSLSVLRVEASMDMLNTMLGVLHLPEDLTVEDVSVNCIIDSRILSSTIAGFLCIVQVNLDRDELTVLSPCPGQLPSKYLLLGGPTMKWVE